MASASEPEVSALRAGSTVLRLLARPLCVPILHAHLDGRLRFPDLQARMGAAAQAPLRREVDGLRHLGALERHVLRQMPYTVENELTDAGRAILDVAEVGEAWLARDPQRPIALGTAPAKGAIAAVVAGWESTLLDTLALQPASLTEISDLLPRLSYPSIKRRLQAMLAARLVEMRAWDDHGRPYALTDWARQVVDLIAAASRCERTHLARTGVPSTARDTQTLALLESKSAEQVLATNKPVR